MLTFVQWRRLPENAVKYPLGKKREALNNYKFYEQQMNDPIHTHEFTEINFLVTKPGCLAPCTKAACKSFPKGAAPCDGKIYQKQEEENLMNYASASISTPATETQDQRKYLARRLDEVYSTKRDGLEAKFGLTDDDTPHGPKEVAERIAAGKFIIRGLDNDKSGFEYKYWSAADLIQWRDPAKKADQAGFDAAKAELKAKRQTALDAVKIKAPEDALAVIIDLEAWTPTGAAN